MALCRGYYDPRDGFGSTAAGTTARRHTYRPPALLVASHVGGSAARIGGAGYAVKVKELVRNGASPNELDNEGRPLLHSALANGFLEVGRALVLGGADVNAKDGMGRTAMHWVAAPSRYQATALTDQGVKRVSKKEEDLLLGILAGEARNDPGAAELAEDTRRQRVEQEKDEIARRELAELLIARGVDVNATDSTGATPLELATSSLHQPLAELLRTRGARAPVK